MIDCFYFSVLVSLFVLLKMCMYVCMYNLRRALQDAYVFNFLVLAHQSPPPPPHAAVASKPSSSHFLPNVLRPLSIQ